jgi:hypothetical protein
VLFGSPRIRDSARAMRSRCLDALQPQLRPWIQVHAHQLNWVLTPNPDFQGRSRCLACESCHARVVSVRPSFPTSLSARNLARAASSCRGCLRRFGLLAVIHRRRKLPLETISGSALWRGRNMSSAEEYREFAEECLGWARTARSDRERRIFLQMAEVWLEAAARSEKNAGRPTE